MTHIIPEDQLEEVYLKKKLSARDTAQVFGCSYSTILRKLRKYGYIVRQHSVKGRKHPKHSEETKIKMSKSWTYSKIMTPERNKKLSQTILKKTNRNEWHGFTSSQMKDLWKNKEYREYTLKKTREALNLKPNKAELKLFSVIEKICPNEYAFVGDGTFTIRGYCPDFLNINGQKKLIELFGDYWHRNDDEGNRIFLFRLFGYDTLVVWEKELKDLESLKRKIGVFNNGQA